MNINTAENIILSHFHSWQQLCPAWSRSMLTRVIFTFLVTATCSIFSCERHTTQIDHILLRVHLRSLSYVCFDKKCHGLVVVAFTSAPMPSPRLPRRHHDRIHFSYPDISSNSRQTDKGHKNTGTVQTKLNCCWCCRFPKTSIITSRNIYLPMLVIVDELFPFANQAPSSVVHSYGPLRLFSVMA